MSSNRAKGTAASSSWRLTLPIHPAGNLFPPMSPDELRALGEDIIKNGLTSPIVLWQPDPRSPLSLLDGINRLDAIEITTGKPLIIGAPSLTAGDFLACNKVTVLDKSVDPYTYVISANIHRRHLTAEQKRELIAKLIKATPEKSDRQIAETVKASPTTVGTVRANMEAKGEVSKLDTRTDAKGVKQPAHKKDCWSPLRRQTYRNQQRLKADAAAKTQQPTTAAQERNDVGPHSKGEAERLPARVDELQAEKRQLESEIEDAKTAAPASDQPLTVLIELLGQIITDGNRPAWLQPLSLREQQQAKSLIERLRDDLHELVGLRQAAKAMPDAATPHPDDGLDIPASLRRAP
jgi:hypothetical protein